MHSSMASAAALLIAATLGMTAAQSQTTTTPAQRSQEQGQSQSPSQERNPLPGSPEHQRQVDDALNSESGRAGKAEPLPEAMVDVRVFVDGALNVPGASKDSQTVPAKFSKHNAALDELPIMAARLSDEDRNKIMATLRTANPPVAGVDATVAQQLPLNVEMIDLPDSLKREVPQVSDLQYVRSAGRILLVNPRNRIVLAEIKS